MELAEIVLELELEAADWEDELGISLPSRLKIFDEALEKYAEMNQVELGPVERVQSKFLYLNFWFQGEKLLLQEHLVRAASPFNATFGRIVMIANKQEFSGTDATFVAEGLMNNDLYRVIALALISEFTRESRQLRAIEMNVPIYLGKFNLLLAALKPADMELWLHNQIAKQIVEGEEKKATRTCEMGSCTNGASWIVICPFSDGQEYLCNQHKSADDFSFETYRLIFSNSCGHHADRRDCRYVLVGNVEMISLSFEEIHNSDEREDNSGEVDKGY